MAQEESRWDAHHVAVLDTIRHAPLMEAHAEGMRREVVDHGMNSWVSWEMLLHVARHFDRVVVTGCQRSGTTFAAQQLAEMLGYTHLDETAFHTHDREFFEQLLEEHSKVVVQAPAILHHMKDFEDHVLLVVMERNPNDIVRSMYRFGWYAPSVSSEMKKFREEPSISPYDLVQTKQEFGHTLKALHLPYEELKKAPGYVMQREGWGIKQVAPEETKSGAEQESS